MKLNEYLDELIGIDRFDFDYYLSERTQKMIRREHESFNAWLQLSRNSYGVIRDELKSQGWAEDEDGNLYNKRELERQNAYAILADCGVPFIDGEPVGI